MKEAVAVNIEEKVLEDIASLDAGASMVATAVERYKTAKADTSGAAITTPLVTLARAISGDHGLVNLAAVAERLEGEDVEDVETFASLAVKLANKLAITLDTLDTTPYVTAAERLVALAASPYQLVEDDVLVEAGKAVTAWKTAYTAYQQASGANVQRRVAGGRGAPRRGGSRGPGKWLEDHGWYFTAECQSCGHVIRSASNTGSFSHEMAKHWPSCRGIDGKPLRDAEGNRVERIYQGDEAMDALSAAMYAVADGEMEAEGGGFIIRHVDDPSFAAA